MQEGAPAHMGVAPVVSALQDFQRLALAVDLDPAAVVAILGQAVKFLRMNAGKSAHKSALL